MKNSGYNLHIKHDDTLSAVDRACDIAFPAGKGAAGAGFHNGGDTRFYVWGKFSDMVRVYSALRNNGYVVRVERDIVKC